MTPTDSIKARVSMTGLSLGGSEATMMEVAREVAATIVSQYDEYLGPEIRSGGHDNNADVQDALAAIEAWRNRTVADAEPVAWRYSYKGGWAYTDNEMNAEELKYIGHTVEPLYAAPPAPSTDKQALKKVVGFAHQGDGYRIVTEDDKQVGQTAPNDVANYAECHANCDDPGCPYTHTNETWQQCAERLGAGVATLEAQNKALAAGIEKLREALVEAEDTLQLVEGPAFPDPQYHAEVKALGRRIGFGALMSTASAGWMEVAAETGSPVGGAFVAGPCHGTVVSTLTAIRAALQSTEPEAKLSEPSSSIQNLAGSFSKEK